MLGLGFGHSGQHVLHIDQVVIKNLLSNIQEPENFRVSNRVEDALTLFSTHDQITASQQGQLLRQGALFHFELHTQFVHSDFSGAQSVEDCDSKRVTQRLEKLGFESGKIVHKAGNTISSRLP
jgi:hypothetical protein